MRPQKNTFALLYSALVGRPDKTAAHGTFIHGDKTSMFMHEHQNKKRTPESC